MSLINEALKKAQRLRHEQQAGPVTDAPAGEIRKRARPMRAQTLVLLIAGASVLVVFSVVITVYLLNSEDDAPAFSPTVIVTPPTSAPLVDPAAPSPVIVAPVIPNSAAAPETSPAIEPVATSATPPAIVVPDLAATTPASAPDLAPVATAPEPASSTATSTPASAPAASEPPPTAAAAKLAAAVEAIAPDPDVRAQQFIDALRVTGIRASGNDSKVLMNDRVYRVNDIVDRTLGLKLIKVAPDSLTFSDPTGATYTKIF
jgi:hypothetical protein